MDDRKMTVTETDGELVGFSASYLTIAHTAAVALSALVDESGRFKYRFDSVTGNVAQGYNVLRHCGAIWAMMDVYRDTMDRRLITASLRAVRYLLNGYVKFYPSARYVCVCEEGKIKLGGNALAILALLEVYRVTKDRLFLSLAEAMGDYLLQQWIPGQDFVHKRIYPGGQATSFKSMYYTGEALLALLSLYEMTGARKWLDYSAQIEATLAPRNYGVQEQSHWMLYALDRLCQHNREKRWIEHASMIADDIMQNPEYLNWERSTPIACRTEGLLAYLRLLGTDMGDVAERRSSAFSIIRRNLSLQKKYRHAEGAFIRGGLDRRAAEIRIDYIQHNASAFLYCYRLLGKDNTLGMWS